MTLLERIGDWLAANARAVRDSPPLTGAVAGLWLFLVVLASGGNPLMAFLVAAPLVTLGMYAVDQVLGYLRDGGSEAEQSNAPATPYDPADEESAIARLRERDAAGDVDHAESDRRLDALLDTEGVSRDEAASPTRTRTLERREANR
jgi:hypothetical protein